MLFFRKPPANPTNQESNRLINNFITWALVLFLAYTFIFGHERPPAQVKPSAAAEAGYTPFSNFAIVKNLASGGTQLVYLNKNTPKLNLGLNASDLASIKQKTIPADSDNIPLYEVEIYGQNSSDIIINTIDGGTLQSGR